MTTSGRVASVPAETTMMTWRAAERGATRLGGERIAVARLGARGNLLTIPPATALAISDVLVSGRRVHGTKQHGHSQHPIGLRRWCAGPAEDRYHAGAVLFRWDWDLRYHGIAERLLRTRAPPNTLVEHLEHEDDSGCQYQPDQETRETSNQSAGSEAAQPPAAGLGGRTRLSRLQNEVPSRRRSGRKGLFLRQGVVQLILEAGSCLCLPKRCDLALKLSDLLLWQQPIGPGCAARPDCSCRPRADSAKAFVNAAESSGVAPVPRELDRPRGGVLLRGISGNGDLMLQLRTAIPNAPPALRQPIPPGQCGRRRRSGSW